MYLSELFLDQVDGDFSVESVEAALKKCEEELNGRLMGKHGEKHLADCFVEANGTAYIPNEQGYEILAFWDVYKEFDQEIREEVKASAQILSLAREIRIKCQ